MSGPGIEESERADFNLKLMQRLEEFYFDEQGEKNGQMLFFGFAQNHHQHFTEECDASKVEHTLQTTTVHKEFCGIFEEVIAKVVNEVHEKASGEDFVAALEWQRN